MGPYIPAAVVDAERPVVSGADRYKRRRNAETPHVSLFMYSVLCTLASLLLPEVWHSAPTTVRYRRTVPMLRFAELCSVVVQYVPHGKQKDVLVRRSEGGFWGGLGVVP